MIIYEPRGRAREYAALAANLYSGCEHGCRYCYAPACLHRSPGEFHANAVQRKGVFESLQKEVHKHRNNTDPILLCFTCDPYQPIEAEHGLTRSAITLFAENDVKYSILTKGGMRAARDFDVMCNSKCEFGTTLLFTDKRSQEEWEPAAAPFADRILAIEKAHELGIYTYVSVEPVIDPDQAIRLIEQLHPIVDFWKVGKLNHHPLARQIDWQRFYNDAIEQLEACNANYYIKKDLLKYANGSR